MERIDHITIVGMGALGTMYGEFFGGRLGWDHVEFLADARRVQSYQGRRITCNGRLCDFRVKDGSRMPEKPAQLLIFAVKATALDSAIETARKYVGENTIILSVLNGISSEEIISEALGREHVLYCVAQGMDAVKLGDDLAYSHMGQICIGIPADQREKEPLLDAVLELFDRTGLPYTKEPDILRRLWCKWMLNVGVNQTVMVTEGNYGTVQKPGAAREMMKAAMAEVVALAEREHIRVTEEDLESYMDLTDSLNPEGMPSMRQDGIAGRPTEVEFFAGTVIAKAEKYGLDVPVNRELYRRVKEMEDAGSVYETILSEQNERSSRMEITVLCYKKCTTCQKALKWLDANGISYKERPIKEENPGRQELEEWYKKSGLPLKKFFNTSGNLYKELKLKDKLPRMSEAEQLDLLATDGMLVKRPLVVGEDFVLTGFKEADWKEKLL